MLTNEQDQEETVTRSSSHGMAVTEGDPNTQPVRGNSAEQAECITSTKTSKSRASGSYIQYKKNTSHG